MSEEILYFDELPEELPPEFEGTLNAWVRAVVTDKDGNVEKHPWQQSRSFVQQFLQGLEALLYQTDVWTVDMGGSSRLIRFSKYASPNQWMDGDAGVANKGLLVGTDNTAVTVTDYDLGAQIDHGSGAGELVYGVTSFLAPRAVGANMDLYISRVFQNSSGGLITVNEVGLAVTTEITAGGGVFLLFAHDLLTVAIANGASAAIQYTLRTTV